ncbi:DUF1351 domain-containing protein [Hungatella hathewayi]|nr:DUF1351 domain-containing protein [Hungatella hathewayi]
MEDLTMAELTVQVKQKVGNIQFNYEEIKETLAAQMDLYKDAQFSEDTKKDAKKEVAALRKMKKAIEEKRKEVKKQCLVPYADFEAKCKELQGLIDQPINLISGQITAFEEKRIQQKKEKINGIFKEVFEGADISIDRIYNPKWENSTYTLSKIQKELEDEAVKISTELKTLQSLRTDCKDDATGIYLRTLDLTEAIAYVNEYEETKQKVLEKEKEKQASIPEPEPVQAFTPQPAPREVIEKAATSEEVPFVQPNTKKVVYTVVGTAEELEQIETYMNSVGIFFDRTEV